MAAWHVRFDRHAEKEFSRLGTADQRRVRAFIDGRLLEADDPRSLGAALTGTLAGVWKYRIGDIRILVSIEDEHLLILVIAIGNRREAYR